MNDIIRINNKRYNHGFTMIELIIVIAITAIIALAVAVFIKAPINAYDDSAQRAEVVDQAHTVIKRIKRDVQASLPNSVRITDTGTKVFLEMMTVSGGGKYRAQQTSTGMGDILDFTVADTSFDMLNSSYTFSGGEKIVVANIGSPGFDAYASDNMSNYNGAIGSTVSNIVINAKKFPLESPGEKFYIVDNVVTYVCDRTSKTMTKYWGYNPTASQPINDLAAPLSTALSGLLAKNLEDCRFTYNQGQNSRNAVVSIFVKLKKNQQVINLYGESYVPNS